MRSVLAGFRNFILRGNVIDLAVGIVIGAAFATLVGAFTTAFIEPLIKLIGGGGELGGSFTIKGVEFNWATFVNAIIIFLITAAAIYFFVVVPVNRFAKKRIGEADDKDAEQVALLTEIRDALRAQNQGARNPGQSTSDGD